MKRSPKTKDAISEATGTRDRQIQQHLLQEPQHAENGEKENVTTNPKRKKHWLAFLVTDDKELLMTVVTPDLMVFSDGFW